MFSIRAIIKCEIKTTFKGPLFTSFFLIKIWCLLELEKGGRSLILPFLPFCRDGLLDFKFYCPKN